MNAVDLRGQAALVTGASRGIGAAVARRLAAAGAAVVLDHHRDAEAAALVVEAIVAAGGSASALDADVSDPEAVAALFAHATERHGRLDVLVNNAGIVKDALLGGMRDADWRRVIDVDLGGVFLCTRQALRTMLPARRGRIVNVSSIQGLRGGRGQANYAAAKAGVLALTRATALEVARHGIRVNSVLPGFIDTDMTKRIQRLAGDRAREEIPVGRLGTPDDVAGLVLFLCSEDADYVTGQGFVVDGGLTVQ